MAGDVTAAQEIIRGMGSKLDRAGVVRWAALKAKATGREREVIAWMSEAFYPLAQSESDRRWLGMFLSGIPAAVQEAMQEVATPGSRTDSFAARIDLAETKLRTLSRQRR